MIIVIDMDGTLCNSVHREHLAKAGQWEEFHSLLSDDHPNPDVARLLCALGKDCYIILLTGRNEKWRGQTISWLHRFSLHQFVDVLIMRPDTNFEKDTDLKPRMLEDHLTVMNADKGQVWFILDDRDKVGEAWRNAGYNCWQPRSGGY
jgi:FMN phosphatase YigB (HAD superfamily)